ncbi:MAG: CBS domain-containing protein [Deltaproteobacteria bacterium]|nr:CBS domain-containing protein [Deltaproteobacteria bacterium]
MFGILYHFRPDFLNCWINCEDLQWEGQLKILLEKLKKKKVHQIMSPNVVGVSLNDHLMVILDRMIKNKYHRLPVLENGKLIGVVYISDIYYFLFSGKPV